MEELDRGAKDIHDDAVRAFPDDFHTAVVGCDLEMFHAGYLRGQYKKAGWDGMG